MKYYREPPRWGMKEIPDVHQQVKNCLDFHKFFKFKIAQGALSYPGISDFIAVKDGVTLFIEAKRHPGVMMNGTKISPGRQSEDQKKFQADVENKGGIYLLVTCGYDLEQKIFELGLNEKSKL